jgi:hypothetical protein
MSNQIEDEVALQLNITHAERFGRVHPLNTGPNGEIDLQQVAGEVVDNWDAFATELG